MDERPQITIDLSPFVGPPAPTVHTCDVCGAQGTWGPTWRWLWEPVTGHRGWHDPPEFTTCSDDCRAKSPYADWKDIEDTHE